MTDMSRRQLLAATGVGLGLATAGCAGAGGERTATAFLQQSEENQAELEDEGERLSREFRSGNITRQEASEQYSELQSELNEELEETARTEAESLDMTVEDSLSAQGSPPLLLVSGSPDALLDYVELDIVNAVSSADRFEEIQQRQQQQQQQQQQQTQENQTAEQSG